jgi:D-aminopeptidase
MKNSITDVPGVQAGHFTLSDGDIQTGVTVILPYPLSVRDRKLFIGSFASGNWNEWTGLHVGQDFGAFSSPIVLCNATTTGIAYDALISFGHSRHQDLPIDNAWPPIVIGIDDGYLNDLRQRRITHDDVLQAIEQASDHAMACGSVGIGRGLCAFGGRGGVGDSSCTVTVAEKEYVIGLLIAANGGTPFRDKDSPQPASVTPSFVAVIATDLPLLPEQLRQLAEVALRGLDGIVQFEDGAQRLALAFSTSNTIDEAFADRFQLFKEKMWAQEHLSGIFSAAAPCCRAALRRALENAETVMGRRGRQAAPMDNETLKKIFVPK